MQWKPLLEPGSGGLITSISVSPHDGKRVLICGDMLGIGWSGDGGSHWQATYGLSSWEIAECTWDPSNADRVWAATMMGPFLSQDGGRHWLSMRVGMPPVSWGNYSVPLQKILFDPNDARHLLAFGGSRRHWGGNNDSVWAVWESHDRGGTWKRLSQVGGGNGSNIIAAGYGGTDSSILYVGYDSHGVWKSVDSGRTWHPMNHGLPHGWIRNLCTHPTNPLIAWAAMGNEGIYKTIDGGEHWTRCQGLSHSGSFEGLAVCTSRPDCLLTCDNSFQGGTVFRSGDGGMTWKAQLSNADYRRAYAAGCQMSALAFDPENPAICFAANTETAVRSTDGGADWIDVTSHPAGPAGHWEGNGFSGLCTLDLRFNPINADDYAIFAMDNGNCWLTSDGAASWFWAGNDHPGYPTWGGKGDIAFGSRDGRILYMTIPCGHHRLTSSIDGGRSWQAMSEEGLPSGDSGGPIYCVPGAPLNIWVVMGGRLCFSSDGGKHWKEVFHRTSPVQQIVPLPGRLTTFFITDDAGVYRTDDGQTFNPVAGASPKDLRSLTVSHNANDAVRLFAVRTEHDHGTLWTWEKGNWSILQERDQMYWVASDPVDSSRLIISTGDNPYHDVARATGLWLSADGGRSWSQQNDGLGMTRMGVVRFNPANHNQIICGTNGRGYWMSTWPSERKGF